MLDARPGKEFCRRIGWYKADAARTGDWDAAVEYYRRALQEDPQRVEYRIALERAMLSASRHHAALAAELEALGDLAGALREYRRAHDLDPSNGPAAVKIANLQQTLRTQIEGARSPAPPRYRPTTPSR